MYFDTRHWLIGSKEKPSLLTFLGMPAETATAMCSMIFGGVLEKVPNLKVCFAHGGRWKLFNKSNHKWIPFKTIHTERKQTRKHCFLFLWSLSLLNVNIKLDFLRDHLETVSLLLKYKQSRSHCYRFSYDICDQAAADPNLSKIGLESNNLLD